MKSKKHLWSVPILAVLSLAALGLASRPALARTAAALGTPPKPITISIQSDTPLGVFHGRAYREIHAFMSSNAPGDAHTKPGSYSVPIVIACPVRAHDFSGFGLVDVLNTVTIEASFAWPPGGSGNALPEGGLLFDGSLYGGAFGFWFSTDGTAFNNINLTHKQYDCGLLASTGSTCPLDVPAFTGKVMSVSSETDVVLGGFLERAEPGDPAFKNYRDYEIAGSAHISSQDADFRNVGNPQQTPIDISPVYRALFTSLTDWLDDDVDGEHHNGAHHDGVLVGERDGEGDDHGEAPPASVAIDSLNQDPVIDPLAFSIALELVRDADGNAVGGIRLPHVRTTVKGKQIGAPLGSYNGRFLATNSFFLEISGTFTPFSALTLCERYTDHDGYVHSVARGAAHALKHGWILSADSAAYVRAAAESDIGRHCGDHQ